MSKKILVLIIVLIVLLILGVATFFGGRFLLNKTGYAFLGDEFTIDQELPIQIVGEDLKIRLVKFYNSPCPDGAVCVWSGLALDFEITHNQEKIKKDMVEGYTEAFGYKIYIIESDYTSYARLKVMK